MGPASLARNMMSVSSDIIHSRREWLDIGLSITDMGDGILIEQAGRSYKARKWRLTDRLLDVVECAIRHGLTAFWVEGHPSQLYLQGGSRFGTGSHHITIARRHDEAWIITIGEGHRPPHLEALSINKKFKRFIMRTGVSYRWERMGSQHMVLRPQELDHVLSRLDKDIIDGVETVPRKPSAGVPTPGRDIIPELQLEIAFLEMLDAKDRKGLKEVKVRQQYEGFVPDIIIEMKQKPLVIVELKMTNAGVAELDHLKKQMKSDSIKTMGHRNGLHGVLIAPDFQQDFIKEVGTKEANISLYAYDYNPDLTLKCLAGLDILEDLGLYP